jgi:hypothetical protein
VSLGWLISCSPKFQGLCVHTLLQLLRAVVGTQPEYKCVRLTVSVGVEETNSEHPSTDANAKQPRDFEGCYG